MELISGRNKEEVLGKSLLELFPDYVAKEEGKAVEQALRGASVTFRKHSNPFVQEQGFYEINLFPLHIEGQLAGGIGTLYEVTEIIRLEQEQANHKLGQQQEILNAILRAQERERERISESLHNGIGQLLFAVKLNLQTLKTKPMPPETEVVLTKVYDLLNEAIRQSRSVSFELVPTILKDFGLMATLEDLARTLSSPALRVEVQAAGMETRLEKFLELTVFRIIQALLSNVIEHSGATVAIVKLTKNESSLVIGVADDGKGFDPATARATVKENSLQTVSNRITLLDGNLNIDSAVGKGTRIMVTLPLSKPA
jgi:signal transduction histidine kinase